MPFRKRRRTAVLSDSEDEDEAPEAPTVNNIFGSDSESESESESESKATKAPTVIDVTTVNDAPEAPTVIDLTEDKEVIDLSSDSDDESNQPCPKTLHDTLVTKAWKGYEDVLEDGITYTCEMDDSLICLTFEGASEDYDDEPASQLLSDGVEFVADHYGISMDAIALCELSFTLTIRNGTMHINNWEFNITEDAQDIIDEETDDEE